MVRGVVEGKVASSTRGAYGALLLVQEPGDFCTVPRRKMLCLSRAYLFVQCWVGGKGRKLAPFLEGIFYYETFNTNYLLLEKKPPPLSDIPML